MPEPHAEKVRTLNQSLAERFKTSPGVIAEMRRQGYLVVPFPGDNTTTAVHEVCSNPAPHGAGESCFVTCKCGTGSGCTSPTCTGTPRPSPTSVTELLHSFDKATGMCRCGSGPLTTAEWVAHYKAQDEPTRTNPTRPES